jgi:hypothetical protein
VHTYPIALVELGSEDQKDQICPMLSDSSRFGRCFITYRVINSKNCIEIKCLPYKVREVGGWVKPRLASGILTCVYNLKPQAPLGFGTS